MRVPNVVVVGRPNVGKSSVFNWIAGIRLAIVDPTAGVTRDRVSYLVQEREQYFEMVDTGGIGITDSDDLTDHIEEQIQIAIDSADVVVFVVDTQTGLLALDNEVARRLRKLDVPIILVANKTDSDHIDSQADEFHSLGHGEPIRVSTTQNRGRERLLTAIFDRLPILSAEDEVPEEPILKVAIVGRRNVGKSTFVNTLAKTDRMIVSEVPGTTRDSVDVRFDMDNKSLIAIDTPGLKRTKAVKTDLDFYSTHRAQRSIRRADVVLLFFDAAQEISRLDKQLCSYIAENHKPCIFVVNKWDLYAGGVQTEEWADYLQEQLRMMWHVPIIFITGQSGKNVKALINHAQMLFGQSRQRISTGRLNTLIRAALDRNPPPLHYHRRPKIYYATQVSIGPPTMVLFCNNPAAFTKPYRRYLLGVMRDQLSFGEIPIQIYYRQRKSNDKRDEIASEMARG